MFAPPLYMYLSLFAASAAESEVRTAFSAFAAAKKKQKNGE